MTDRFAASPPAPGTCCCGHGARCTCSLKKEPYLESVPEDFSQILQQSKEQMKHRGPNLNNHDTKPTIFANGHHKPVHKFNDAHNHCGAPYRVPSRTNSHNSGGHNPREIAQRSTDSLPLTSKPNVHHESPLHNVLSAGQPIRQALSEHNSPLIAPTNVPNISYPVEIPPLSPNAYSYSPFESHTPAMQPQPHLPNEIPEHWFTTHDEAHNNGPPSVPELAYIDWSKYGFAQPSPALDSTNNMKTLYAGLANNQMPSYATSMEHLNQFGSGFNTSSGEISEVEDIPTSFRPSTLRTISHASNDHSSVAATEDDSTNHRLSTASSYHGTPAGNALAENFDSLDIDQFIAEQAQKNMQQNFTYQSPQSITTDLAPQQFQQAPYPTQQQKFQQQIPQSLTPPQSQHTMSTPPESIRGFSITSHPSPEELSEPQVAYSIKELQAQAHQGFVNDITTADQLQMLSNDPMWCQPDVDQYGENRAFTLDDEREDEQWAR